MAALGAPLDVLPKDVTVADIPSAGRYTVAGCADIRNFVAHGAKQTDSLTLHPKLTVRILTLSVDLLSRWWHELREDRGTARKDLATADLTPLVANSRVAFVGALKDVLSAGANPGGRLKYESSWRTSGGLA